MSTIPNSTHVPDGRIAGSFRDPSGYVFFRQGRLFRAIDDSCHEALSDLANRGVLSDLIRQEMIVRSEVGVDVDLQKILAAEQPGYTHFVEHEVIWPVTFPYEWTVSMLADAAVLTIDLQLRLLAAGLSLKDASAYNVLFIGGRPRFIDLGSIERPARQDIWFALGQFQQMFLFPLLLCRHRGWDPRSYFLASLDGRDLEQVVQEFSWLNLLQPGMLLDVSLPLLLGRWAERSTPTDLQVQSAKTDGNPAAQIANLRRLRRKTLRLAATYRPRGAWSNYAANCHYDDAAAAAKRLVGDFLSETAPRRVVDLGCNTGEFSRLAAALGAEVVAVDADHDAVELLFRQLRKEPARISPMVIDLTNPSPAIGYMNRERPAFLDRIRGDCVLSLALLHHLLVAGNLSLDAVCEMFATLTDRDLVLEFVPTDDPMFRRLMRFRVDLFGGLTLNAVRDAFTRRFSLLKESPLPQSGRTLLFLRKT